MQELIGNYDLFSIAHNGDAICVTTNGIVKADGTAVMGAGIAKQANNKYHLDKILGSYIKQYGNRAFRLGQITRNQNEIVTIFSFPTKHHWKEDSDINLIVTSANQLVEMCNKFNIHNCYLTRPGCGLGKLNWETTVKPWLELILDDRFIVLGG